MTILIAEDNLSHQKITEYVLKKYNVPAGHIVVRDGQEVLDYLHNEGHYTDKEKYPVPNLILLDLNLPKRDGREVLKLIKEEPQLKNIPVVIVSTSDREEDIVFASRMGVVGYISKSIGFDAFSTELGSVLQYARPE
jgi:CheY-like chemotaxis protein